MAFVVSVRSTERQHSSELRCLHLQRKAGTELRAELHHLGKDRIGLVIADHIHDLMTGEIVDDDGLLLREYPLMPVEQAV